MDEVVLEVVKQAPAMGVLVVLVLVFLKHVHMEGCANREVVREQSEAIKKQAEAITELRLVIAQKVKSDV